MVADVQRAIATASAWRTGSSQSMLSPAGVSRFRSPTVVHTATTCMRFAVSVPVLSVQITVVDPSVSTALEPLDQCSLTGKDPDTDPQPTPTISRAKRPKTRM